MIHIVGDSHAPIVFRCVADFRGISITDDVTKADLVIIAQDTPTDERGDRNQGPIVQHVYETLRQTTVPVILTSQVTPGFTRQFNCERLYCQAETLRIKDAFTRALNPEYIAIGCMNPKAILPREICDYYRYFCSRIHRCTYEEAEFSKIAINVTLAHQVTLANVLSEKAAKYGCDWQTIKKILQDDKRIGPHAYLEPGDWKKSKHLLRDYHWFHEVSQENS